MARSTLPGNRPATPQRSPTTSAVLLVIEGETLGRRFVLDEDADIGRDTWCALHIPDLCASRRHATLRMRDGIWFVEDRKSRNGTYVNGKRIQRTRLWYGDRIGLGAGVTLLFARVDRVELHEARVRRLQAMAGFASDLSAQLRKLIERSKQGEGLAASDQAMKLADDLQAFASEHQSELEPTAIGPAVEAAANILRDDLPADVDLLVEMQTPELQVDARAEMLQRIVVEIGRAAMSTMHEGGSLRLTVDLAEPANTPLPLRGEVEGGAYVRFEFLSSGIDLPSDELWRSFEPFHNGDSVGPAVAFGFTRALGGALDIAMERGYGTRIVVVIPMSQSGDFEEVEPADTDVSGFESPTLMEHSE